LLKNSPPSFGAKDTVIGMSKGLNDCMRCANKLGNTTPYIPPTPFALEIHKGLPMHTPPFFFQFSFFFWKVLSLLFLPPHNTESEEGDRC
jgi:hypothetical protein